MSNIPSLNTFKKSERLLKRKDFLTIGRYGSKARGAFLSLVARQNRSTTGKIGLTVSKKIGNACTRNLVKRRFRHILRENKHLFAGKMMIIIANPKSSTASFESLKKDLLSAAKTLNSNNLSKKNKGSSRD